MFVKRITMITNPNNLYKYPKFNIRNIIMEDKIPFKILGESSHEEDFVKENVLTSDNNEWKSKRGVGLPAWISFDLLVESKIKNIMMRYLKNCSTCPKDMVIYGSSDENNFKEIARASRARDSEWLDVKLDTTARYIKVEFLNNQNTTDNKLWSSYTYLYEVVFNKI